MMFSPINQALDLNKKIRYNRLYSSPFQLGIWSLIEPRGSQNHAPQLCWITPNTLGCVWMSGGREGTAGMGIMFSELRNNKKEWSSPKLISQDPIKSEQNPLLFTNEVMGAKEIHLIHTAQSVREPNEISKEGEAFSMQWTASLRHQTRNTEKRRWSNAKDLIDEPAFCRNPPIRRQDGCWLLPIYRSLETGGAFGHDFSEVLLLSADCQTPKQLIKIPSSIGRVHGSIVVSRDGSQLLQFFRSRLADRVYKSIGSLDGLNWEAPQPTELPNNNSSIQAIRLHSGRLAIIFNRFSLEEYPANSTDWGEAIWPRTRWPLSIALSEDDGESWPLIRDIDHGIGFAGQANWMLNEQLAYPTIVEGIPGELHIAYSWGGRQAIRYICLNEFEILGFESNSY